MKEGAPSDPVRLSNSRLLIHCKKPLKRLSSISILRPFLYKAHQSIAGLFSGLKSEEKLYRDVAKMHAEVHCEYSYAKACDQCNIRKICDGFHGDYAKMFGTKEAAAITDGAATDDPVYYIRLQNKIVDNGNET
jgi:hypothetical protein